MKTHTNVTCASFVGVFAGVALALSACGSLAAETRSAGDETATFDESLVVLQRWTTGFTAVVIGTDGRVQRNGIPQLEARSFGGLLTFDITPSGKLIGLPGAILRQGPAELKRQGNAADDRTTFLVSTLLSEPIPPLEWVHSVALSPDGLRLAVHGQRKNDPKVWRLWCVDLASGKSRVFLKERERAVYAMSWSKDSSSLAVSACLPHKYPKGELTSGLYVIHRPLAAASSLELAAPRFTYLGLSAPYRPTWADGDKVIYFTARYLTPKGTLGTYGVYRTRLGQQTAERVSDGIYHGSDADGSVVVSYSVEPHEVVVFKDHGAPGKRFPHTAGELLGGVSQSGRYIGLFKEDKVEFWDLRSGKLAKTSGTVGLGLEGDGHVDRDGYACGWWIKTPRRTARPETNE